jgi:hypothetical protein
MAHDFAHSGYQLRWRAVLTTTNSTQTPILTGLVISYEARLDAPSLLSPTGGTITYSNTPTLSWSPVTGATGYWLQLDNAPGFDSLALRNITLPTEETSYTPDTPLAYGIWYWRVAANDSAGDLGFFSFTFTIVVQPPPIPGFPWPAMLMAVVAALSLDLHRRRQRR